ncbi:MAG TPA: hypothetical protein VJ817_07110 [Gemmatimonadales bacterium]|nr:hypothetical protein [Gemmatimonadales bacterium]
MKLHFQPVLLAASLVVAPGCGSTLSQTTTFECTTQAQPQPTDCALVQAVAQDPSGNAIPFLPVRVDSVVPAIGQVYLSSATVSAADGGFVLLVFRINRFEQPAVPDTATVYIKGYANPSPPIGTAPISRAAMVMRFFPLGGLVNPTVGIAVFHPVPAP